MEILIISLFAFLFTISFIFFYKMIYGKEKVRYIFCLENKTIIQTHFKQYSESEVNSIMDIVKNPTETTHITLTDDKNRICIIPFEVLDKCVFKLEIKKFIF